MNAWSYSPAPSNFFLPARWRELLERLQTLAADHQRQVWLVGGTVRDWLLQVPPLDLDCVTSGNPLLLGQELADKLFAVWVPLHPEPAIGRLLWQGISLDLAALRAPDIEADLKARDFTINALALELGSFLAGKGELLDPGGGVDDLRARRLRLAGPEVLQQDPVRVLRGYRFMAELDLSLDRTMEKSLILAGPGLAQAPPERLAPEWLKLMAGPQAPAALRALDSAGLLSLLLPAWEAGRGLSQNRFHHLAVADHSLACVQYLEKILAEPEEFWPPLVQELRLYTDPQTRALLKTAALLHDIGKPQVQVLLPSGERAFYRHEQAGQELAFGQTRRLGLSKNQARTIAELVRLHMRPFQLLTQYKQMGRLSGRATRRLLQQAGPHLGGLWALALADTLAGRGSDRPPEIECQLLELGRHILRARDEIWAQALLSPPLLNGHDLMEALALPPGPNIGRLLSLIREAQLDGRLTSKEQALAWAQRLGSQAITHKKANTI